MQDVDINAQVAPKTTMSVGPGAGATVAPAAVLGLWIARRRQNKRRLDPEKANLNASEDLTL